MICKVKFDALEFGIQGLHFGGGWLIFVLLQIVGSNHEEQQKTFGKHFDVGDELVSHISRESIDVLEANYRVSGRISHTIFSSMDFDAIVAYCYFKICRMICRITKRSWLRNSELFSRYDEVCTARVTFQVPRGLIKFVSYQDADSHLHACCVQIAIRSMTYICVPFFQAKAR
jgi:hypothetical protein